MNLNTLQASLKNQLNIAIKGNNLTTAQASEVIHSELGNLLARAEILEVIPFPEEVVGVSKAEMAMYVERYQEMMDLWYGKAMDIFVIVEALEKLRFDDATTEIKLITKLVDLGHTVDLETRGTFGELSSAFYGDKAGKWARAMKNVKDDVAYAEKVKADNTAQSSNGLATAR